MTLCMVCTVENTIATITIFQGPLDVKHPILRTQSDEVAALHPKANNTNHNELQYLL